MIRTRPIEARLRREHPAKSERACRCIEGIPELFAVHVEHDARSVTGSGQRSWMTPLVRTHLISVIQPSERRETRTIHCRFLDFGIVMPIAAFIRGL